jgi:DUF4097 and DUF4098 domain-containing protein YvlB
MLTLTIVLSQTAFAQKKIEKNIAVQSTETIFLNLKFASNIVIKTWDKSEVGISTTVNINDNAHNDNFEIEIKKEDNQLKITSIIKGLNKISDGKTIISTQKKHQYQYGNNYGFWDEDSKVYVNVYSHNDRQITADIDYEIYIPQANALKIKTISGNIKTEAEIKKLSLKSISGDIDINIAENQKKSFRLKTISGDVYSNIQLDTGNKDKDEDGLPRIGGGYGSDLVAKMNGGGDEVQLETISGNIFIRKKK